MIYHDVIIVGGGASGLLAAIIAKDYGIDVAVVESGDRIGKKILTTGNGRCNVTNKYIDAPYDRYHCDNPDFFKAALSKFSVASTINFFEGLGLHLTTLEEGKMYPMSLQASSVLDVLRFAIEDREIPIYLNCKVKSIYNNLKGFKISTENQEIPFLNCGKLILACGGNSLSSTGSDGSGYNLAKALGHKVITPVPALVQLKLDNKNLRGLSGIKFNGFAEVLVNDAPMRKEFGEILFTDYGISGPPILQLSRIATKALNAKNKVTLKVDMMPQFTLEELTDFLEGQWGLLGHRSLYNSLIGIVNKKMIPIMLKEAKVDNIHKPASDITYEEKNNIINIIKNWEFICTGHNGFNNSQVTAGGIDTTDINPETLESKLIKGLYLIGEILDVDGDCGGFNLQWAWSSAHAAASSLI